jgi:FkbM family methyltransferase
MKIKNLTKVVGRRTEKIHGKLSFSVYGEDVLIDSLLDEIQNGFYVDVGAHHPFRFSNTYLLHKRGWIGMNIDASRKAIDLFDKFRTDDINLLAAVSDRQESLTYYSNSLGALNTFDKSKYEIAKEKFQNKETVRSTTLAKLLSDYLPKAQKIDFLNVDIEGFDLKALSTFPWAEYTPKLICVEDLNFNPENPLESRTYSFLKEKGYRLKAIIPQTLFFVPHDQAS